MLVRSDVYHLPRRTTADARGLALGIDVAVVHVPGAVDDKAVLDRRSAGRAVSATLDCDGEAVLASVGESDGGVGRALDVRDDGSPSLCRARPAPDGLLIVGMVAQDDVALEAGREFGKIFNTRHFGWLPK